METAGDRLTFIGHACVLVESAGTRVLTDPLLVRRFAHLRRLVPVPSVPQLGAADGILISHAHLDHLHLPSLRRLARDAPIVVPAGCARLVRRAGFHDVREVVPGDTVQVGAAEVLVTRADHDGRRWPLARRTPALGYVMQLRRRIYFAGDTDLFDGMRDFAGALDLALLPVAGWGPRLPPGHMDPESAARAAAILEPRVAVPIHWGTYGTLTSRDGDPQLPAREFAGHAASYAPDVEVRILRPGESLPL
jgi:L-ascorbate metabolism protein UlaG (beta-lactamase superfamily)